MKKYIFLALAVIFTACNDATDKSSSSTAEPADTPADYFLGSWALDLDYENNTAGWLNISKENDYLDAELLWRWGSVTPVEFAFYTDGQFFVTRGRNIVREKDAEGNAAKTHHAINWLNIVKTGDDKIGGIAYFPSASGLKMEKVNFSGKRIPEATEKPDLSTVDFGDPVSLISENSLDGWVLLEKGAVNGWSVTDGVLRNDPVQNKEGEHIHYGNLKTTEEYEDFRLTLEVNVPEGSNSGIYLRGIYEVQVSDSYGKETDSHNMGALYSRIEPSVSAEKPAGSWQDLDITLYDRYLTVILNGIPIIENQPVRGVTGGAITADEFAPGPIYLQGDHGAVAYRNIELTPIVK